jgi:hypothetical protein
VPGHRDIVGHSRSPAALGAHATADLRVRFPVLERNWLAYRDRDVAVIGVDIQDTVDAARWFIDNFGLRCGRPRCNQDSYCNVIGLEGGGDGLDSRTWRAPLLAEQCPTARPSQWQPRGVP